MKILAWLAMVIVALVVLIPPADAKRGGGEGRGCSTEHYRLVIEREDAFRLCVFEKQ